LNRDSTRPAEMIHHAFSDSLTKASQSRLGVLSDLLRRTSDSVRYVDYRQAECDCEQLAASILHIYSHHELESFSFTAIPRGGSIVLGMLSYVLDLQPAQLEVDLVSPRPLVIVDDCALSGHRFADFLSKTSSSHVVFVHLYSHPNLRQAILSRESRVKHCLAAHDLTDHASEYYQIPAEYQAWQNRWQQRLGANRYWFGQSDPVCFAWSEPEYQFWNEEMERLESGWHFLAPHRCLKNKWNLGLPPKGLSKREWRVTASVVSGWFDGMLWLCQTHTHQVYSLTGLSADMWRTLAVYGDMNVAAEYLLSEYAVDPKTLRRDLSAFAKELLAAQLLEKTSESLHLDT